MEISYTVDQLLEEKASDCEFKGTVTIQVPLYHERIRLPKVLGIDKVQKMAESKADKDGKANLQDAMDSMEFMGQAAEKIMKYIIRCELTHSDGTTKLQTTEDLFGHPEAGEIVSGVVNKFMAGFLGKKKALPSDANLKP